MKKQSFFAMLAAVIGIAAYGSNSAIGANYGYEPYEPYKASYFPVGFYVQDDNQEILRMIPLSTEVTHYRAYLQAMPNQRYILHVNNFSEERVGLVIAVDGRNIISGKQSWLGSNESMYVLDPHESADYEGWRTDTNQTNRFYFTHASNSYAAAWGDTSAMGVIAMAVYPERSRPAQVYQPKRSQPLAPVSESSVSMRGMPADAAAPAAMSSPGTGYGETMYSPSDNVEFQPSSQQIEKVVLKYEWRETLCEKKILPECSREIQPAPGNRLWPEQNNGFAPPPPVLR